MNSVIKRFNVCTLEYNNYIAQKINVMEKVVFIDLRVLYPEWHVKVSKALKNKDGSLKMSDKRGVFYAPWCRDAILELYRRTKCHFVIMSDEKNHGLQYCQELFNERLAGNVIDYTVTEKMGQSAAINKLVEQRNFIRYAVISKIDEAVSHQVVCDPLAGFMPKHIEDVAKFLDTVKRRD